MVCRIAPGLLLAMPRRPDPAFANTVVLVIEHDERGAFGLIINKPTEMRLSDALREAGLVWPEPTPHVIWDGGPVSAGPDEPDGFILHHPDGIEHDRSKDSDEWGDDFLLYPFPPEIDMIDALASEAPNRLRFFMGYVEWEAGQLEDELRHDAWILAPADPVLVFDTPAEHIWEAAFHSLGVDPSAIVQSRGLH